MTSSKIFIILFLQNIVLSVKYNYKNFDFSDSDFNNFHQKAFQDFENQKLKINQNKNFQNIPKKNQFSDIFQQIPDMEEMFNNITTPKKLRSLQSSFLWKIYSSGQKDSLNIPFIKKPQNFKSPENPFQASKSIKNLLKQNSDSFEKRLAKSTFNEINKFRNSKGLPFYKWSEEIYIKTLEHTDYMVKRNKLSHDNFSKRLEKFGASVENVAMFMKGGLDCDGIGRKFEDQWEHSPGHRKNMLARNVEFAAVGVRDLGRDTYYATMIAVK